MTIELPCAREVALVKTRVLEVAPEMAGIPDAWVREFLTDGKYVRSRLLFLSYYAAGGDLVSRDVVDAAAAIELIHTASLVHDDILDDAETRRGLLSAPVLIGDPLSILFGDALFTEAFWLAACLGPEVATLARDAVRDMVIGESRELAHRAPDWSAADAQVVAKEKTAGVMAAACAIGGVLAKAGPDEVAGLKTFGLKVGMAFQAVDDALDLSGEEDTVGKPIGIDARVGAPNLAAALGGDGAQAARDLAHQWVEEAVAAIGKLPDTPEKAQLEELAGFIVARLR